MTKENQETNEATVAVTANTIKKDRKKIIEQKKLKTKKSKVKLNKKKSTDLSKNELKLQQEMLRIWKSTYASLREATEKAKEAKVYTSSLKAIVTFVLMKNMFLEVRKEIEKSLVEKLSINFVIRFIKKARNVGEYINLESTNNNNEDEQTGLILVSLRYHLEPVIMASVAWKLSEFDINRAIHMLCPKLYAMKNRDYEFIGQEAAYLRVFWKSGVKVNDTESEKMEKLLEITNECNDSMIETWEKLYTTVNRSNNPFGVNQFNNMLGGFSLNGIWKMETLVEFIKKEMTIEWLDNRFGDSGRVIGRLWKRLYSTKKNTINREEEKKMEEDKMKKTSVFTRKNFYSNGGESNGNNEENGFSSASSSPSLATMMMKKTNFTNEFDSKREFVNRLAIACSLDMFKKNEISIYLDLPELYGAAAHIVMIDENPVINQFLRYCGPCKKYPISFAREALKMNENHMTKTLDMLAWWKEYRNPFIISADKFWELAIETCELDEEILYENYGNIDDFKDLMKELIKNNSFRGKKEMEIEEKKFQKVFTVMANGGIDDEEEEGGSSIGNGNENGINENMDENDKINYIKQSYSRSGSRSRMGSISQSSDSETISMSSDDECSSSSNGNSIEKKNVNGNGSSRGGIYRPPSKRGLYGLTHASIINKRQSMNFGQINKKDLTMTSTTSASTTTSTTPQVPPPLPPPLPTEDFEESMSNEISVAAEALTMFSEAESVTNEITTATESLTLSTTSEVESTSTKSESIQEDVASAADVFAKSTELESTTTTSATTINNNNEITEENDEENAKVLTKSTEVESISSSENQTETTTTTTTATTTVDESVSDL